MIVLVSRAAQNGRSPMTARAAAHQKPVDRARACTPFGGAPDRNGSTRIPRRRAVLECPTPGTEGGRVPGLLQRGTQPRVILGGCTLLTFAQGNRVAPADLNQVRWVSRC